MKTMRLMGMLALLLASSAGAQQKLWSWSAPKEIKGTTALAVAIRDDGAAGMIVGKVTDFGNTRSYHVVMISPNGKTEFTASIPTNDSMEDVVGMYGTKWKIALMGDSLVASDGLKVRIFTQKGGKVLKRILDQKGVELFSRGNFNGWLEKEGNRTWISGSPEEPTIETVSLDGVTLWKMP